ncbi:hypothetical protein PVL29_000375 [Vitis rotundifolia]|uniref:Uncharacterized protein n=1 Tax=Vitis rotundifolia TaxID=103349 RepID=A0AA39ALB7_VITRO|nr:hypothetical protein PVL29_000375 [Vitis rotundifolia]
MEESWDPLARRVPSFGRGLRILLVDHDTTSLMYISSMLESHSFKVMSSRYAGKIVAEQALRDGACFFLQKPVSGNDLRDLWQHVYRKRGSSEFPKESCEGRMDSPSKSQGVKIKEESASAFRNDWFREVGSVSRTNSRTANENDLHGTNHEHWIADLKGKNKQIKPDSGLVEGDAQTTERELLRMAADQKPGCNDRKRSNEDNTEKRKCKRTIYSEQIHSQGISPIEEDGNEKKQKTSTLEKRQYMRWTPDLHFKFTEAIRKLGEKKASPKAILELMKVPDLRQGHISSHLQKYKAQVQSMLDICGNTPLLPLPSSVNISTSNGNRQMGVPQFQERQVSVGVNANASLQLHPPLSLKASPVPGNAGPSNSTEYKLHPNPTKNNNGVQMVDYGKHQGTSQIRERTGPFPSDVNMNENGKGKQPLGFQGNSDPYVALDQATLHRLTAQHCWQSLTQFPTPFKRLTEAQNLAPGLTSSAGRPNSDIPDGIGTTEDAVPRLAHLANSANQSIAYAPGTGHGGLDESGDDWLIEWLSRSLDEDNPDARNFDGPDK